MARRHQTIKDPAAELRLFRRRAWLLLAVMALAGVGLLARLTFLQVLQHDRYATASRDNSIRAEVIAPARGVITDRNGVLLAENVSSYSLYVTPENVPDLDATLAALAQRIELRPADLERFASLRRGRPRFEALVLRRHLDETEAARFAVQRHRFPGVELRGDLSRHYPQGALTAHVVGYVGRVSEAELADASAEQRASDSIGKTGIEKSYDTLLQGRVGYQQVEVDAHGRRLRVLDRILARPGTPLRLNLDVGLQRAARAALAGRPGAVVAIDPRDGAVLAIVSEPSFDPNLFVGGIGSDDYRRLTDDPLRPLLDRALRGLYPPGSTIKPFMLLAGLHVGAITPSDHVWCPGWYTLGSSSHRYRCWQRSGHGRVDALRAVAQSCDVYFYELALRLGIERMHAELGRFGFGRLTGIDLPGELAGVLPSPEWKRRTRKAPWYPGETLIAGIGQGYDTATALQLAQATALLASRGAAPPARVVPPPLGRPPAHTGEVPSIAAEHWQTAIDAMRAVVSPGGTAYKALAGVPYSAAGKTGTAQVFGLSQRPDDRGRNAPRHLQDHALFIAFAPVEAPRIALAVIVENGGSGSGTAAPLARQVLDAWLQPTQAPTPPPDTTP
ncbi:penicillin-binding protein 2 [Immundisolibacter sp.]|uniref:penicillin-binding protein 2 n=1 Tax=Immundisolibacter sp. TaxID=1934948 RepID=UPI0026340E07|nr:penicillin-binding protein 2 [Immundisolibacter sp.]MDD3650776.1 penicillin-binding protein 2 [Immundisolibacter sp.]